VKEKNNDVDLDAMLDVVTIDNNSVEIDENMVSLPGVEEKSELSEEKKKEEEQRNKAKSFSDTPSKICLDEETFNLVLDRLDLFCKRGSISFHDRASNNSARHTTGTTKCNF